MRIGSQVIRFLRPEWAAAVLSLALVAATGCLHKSEKKGSGGGNVDVIQCAGSDTMVNVAQAWAETYAAVNGDVSVEVSGGGSGTGIAGLINGTVDIANASRRMSDDEIVNAKENTGEDAVEHIVGYDALAVFVHKDNPMEEISIRQLAEIYGENGPIDRWSQLGVTIPNPKRDRIILTSRQSNSGTYFYFREAVLGKKHDFRLGTIDLHGSKDVVELIGRTINAIGYTGMGYATPHVKMLRIKKDDASPGVPPMVRTTLDGTYPAARPLLMYTHGEATPVIRAFIDWIRSEPGQKVLVQSGYVPVDERFQAAPAAPAAGGGHP